MTNFSKKALGDTVQRMIANYNQNVIEFKKFVEAGSLSKDKVKEVYESHLETDTKKINWSVNLKKDFLKLTKHKFDESKIGLVMYRPYTKLWLYFDRNLIERPSQLSKFFPGGKPNLMIVISGTGVSKDFSCLMVDTLADLQLLPNDRCFNLFNYDDADAPIDLLSENTPDDLKITENISEEIFSAFKKVYGSDLTKEDIFYYVYGVLHSPEYRKRFNADLKIMLPRIPMAKDFSAFNMAGRELSKWHLNYETIDPFDLAENSEIALDDPKLYQVSKMYFPVVNGEEDKSTIIYNNHIKVEGIPLEAYEYVVNGKSAIEWVMERYQVVLDKNSQILNDPNIWCLEQEDPKYILNLLKRVVRVSSESVKIINALPKLDEVR